MPGCIQKMPASSYVRCSPREDAAPEKMQPCILASPCIALYIYKTMNISRAKKKLENVQKKVGKYAAMASFALVNAKTASDAFLRLMQVCSPL